MILAALLLLAAAAPADEVDRLAWLAGTWTSTKDGVTVSEVWHAPSNGAMGGVGQTNRPGRRAFIEHMKITAEPAGVTFTAITSGQAPTPFVLIRSADGEVVFENKAHDFPQRVIYRRCGQDLCARAEGTVKGKLQAEDWRYTRAR